LDAPSTREEICKALNAAKKIKQQETQKSLLAVQYLSDTFKKQGTMAESQESGTGSVEEEIDESPQSLSIEKGKRQRMSREDVAADCINELELLKKIESTGWSERKLRIHQVTIEKLAFRVENEKTIAAKKQKIQRQGENSSLSI
jgi:hypothetical protein